MEDYSIPIIDAMDILLSWTKPSKQVSVCLSSSRIRPKQLKHQKDILIQQKWTAWWRHQMETFSALLAICEGNSPVTGEFPAQRPVTQSFDVFFDLRLSRPSSEQWWGLWFETPSCPPWRHCNGKDHSSIPLQIFEFEIRVKITHTHMTVLVTASWIANVTFWMG